MSNQINNVVILSLVTAVVVSVITTAILLSNDNFVSSQIRSNIANRNRNVNPAATAHEEAIIDTVEYASPAVVSIVVTRDVPVIREYFEDLSDEGLDPLIREYLERFQAPQYRQEGTETQEIGGGSGFIISEDGMIVTNKHVVSQEDASYTVLTNDGSTHEAKVIARDPFNDIAILQIDATGLPFLEFANSDELQVGQTVIAIGNALAEFQNTVSTGVVSGLSRSIIAGNRTGQSEQLDEVIQTDAAINPGNSGGPLLDIQGRVIGVNVAVALGSENIGFALPANNVNDVVESVRETGQIIRPFLGVRYTNITPGLKASNNLSVDYGILVIGSESAGEPAVIPNSPADKVGIQPGDIILEADGKKLDENNSLSAIIRQKEVGDTITLKILRSEEELEVTATLAAMPS